MRVMLDYTIILTPDTRWSAIDQFERDFGKFFNDMGYDIEVVQTPFKDVNEGQRVLIITRKPEEVESNGGKETSSPKQQFQRLQQKRDKDGKYLNL